MHIDDLPITVDWEVDADAPPLPPGMSKEADVTLPIRLTFVEPSKAEVAQRLGIGGQERFMYEFFEQVVNPFLNRGGNA